MMVSSSTIQSDSLGFHLSFSVQDEILGTSTLYYSFCAVPSDCGQPLSWSDASPILDPSVDVGGGTWVHKYRSPQMSLFSDAGEKWLSIVFDDGDMDSATRIPGIFNKICNLSSNCSLTENWINPTDGLGELSPDISLGGNGFSQLPAVVSNGDGSLSSIWLDYSSPSGQDTGPFALFYSFFDSSSLSWSTPQLVYAASLDGVPFSASPKSDGFWVGAWGNGQVVGLACTPDCSPVDLSVLNPYSFVSGWGVHSYPESANDVAWVGNVSLSNGLIQPMGYLMHGDEVAGPNPLFPVLTPEGDPAGDAFIVSHDSFDFETGTIPFILWDENAGELKWFPSTVFGEGIFFPIVTLVNPPTPVTWTKSSPPPTQKQIGFNVMDSDKGDSLYVTVFLSDSITEIVLVDHVPLNELGVSFPVVSGSCSGTDFTSMQSCDLNVTLHSDSKGLVAPDGSYTLGVRVVDASGNESQSLSSPGLVTIDMSTLALSLISPSPNEVWTQSGNKQFIFDIIDFSFVTKLHARVKTMGPSGEILTLVDELVDNYQSFDVNPDCQGLSATLIRCTIPFSFPSSDTVSFAEDNPPEEGTNTLFVEGLEDEQLNGNSPPVSLIMDGYPPRLVNYAPSGSVSAVPSAITFVMEDASIPILVESVIINGKNVSFSCAPSGNGTIASCVIPPSGIPGGSQMDVSIFSQDGVGNLGQTAFSFFIEGEFTGGSSSSDDFSDIVSSLVLPEITDVVSQTGEGDVVIKGTGIVIPHEIVETFTRFSNRVVQSVSDLVEVTGPSASAIFLGLCTLAGIASDVVFRRAFVKMVSETQRQRQRVLRTVLSVVFFAIPLFIGWYFGLAIGFIFAVLEVVLFIAAAYLFKLLQYYETFGFKPLEG
jgi:hypothetical protein